MRLRTLNRLLGLLTLLLGLTQTALAQSLTVFDAPHAVQTHSQGDSISGNWQLIATLPGENPTYIGTTIARSNNSLTGVFHILNPNTPNCFPPGGNVIPALNLAFTGTVNRNMIELQSAAFENQVITMNLTLSPLTQLMNGTFSVTGGCDDGDYGDVTGRFVPDLSGNWSGTFEGAAATAALTQAQVADSNGWFAITGNH